MIKSVENKQSGAKGLMFYPIRNVLYSHEKIAFQVSFDDGMVNPGSFLPCSALSSPVTG